MEMMNEKQCKNIEETVAIQLAAVRKDLTETINKVSERQDKIEAEQKTMKDQINIMQEKMEEIKNMGKTAVEPEFSAHQQELSVENVKSYSGVAKTPIPPTDPRSDSLNKVIKIEQKADSARRTVSLYPFDVSDIQAEINRGARDENEAKLWAVQLFLRYEMNVKSHVLSTLIIDKIFPPAKSDWKTIYVTFRTITMANTVYSHARNMRREVNVGIYVPKEWYSRYRALEAAAYGERHSVIKYKTRVKWCNTDLQLYRKAPGEQEWSIRRIVDLPPVDLCAEGRQVHSPAPGRQSREKVTTATAVNSAPLNSDQTSSEPRLNPLVV